MAYNDLPLSERAQIIHMGVQAGLKSLSDIRSFYDNATSEEDYDYTAAIKAGEIPKANGHWSDKYKKPNHPTFSEESIYHSEATPGGHWSQRNSLQRWNFSPSAQQISQPGYIQKAIDYLNNGELEGVTLTDSQGRYPSINNTIYGGVLPEVTAASQYKDGGNIYIKHSKRGTFTAAATKHGKSVQEFARQVLANKENYSTTMVRKANFARNARKWKHSTGGPLYPFSFSKQPVPAVRFASGGDTKEEFIPSDTIRNKQVWLNKDTAYQRQRPGTVNLQNITDRLDPLGADTQYVWDSPDRSSYSAFRRNPDYRASQMRLIKSTTSNLFNVPLAQYPEIKVRVPKTTLPPAYSLTMRRIPNGNWIRMGGENNGVAGYEILHLENSPYYGIDYQSAPGSISSGEGSIIQTDSLIKGIPIQELNQRIFDYKTRLGGNFVPSDI